MFKLPHIMVILLSFIFVYFMSRYLKTKDDKFINKYFMITAIATPFFYPAEWIYVYIKNGTIDLSDQLPLYLCSIFWLGWPIAYFLKPGMFKRIMMSSTASLGFVGGLFGLVFNVYVNKYPIYTFIPIRSLSYHIIMILVSVTLWTTGFYKAKKGDEFLAFIPLLLMLVPSIILHILYGWDYLYTAGGPGTPFEPFSKALGIPLFMISMYLFLWLCVRSIMYRKSHYKFKDIIKNKKQN